MVPCSTGRRLALAGEATGVARPLKKWSSLPAGGEGRRPLGVGSLVRGQVGGLQTKTACRRAVGKPAPPCNQHQWVACFKPGAQCALGPPCTHPRQPV